MRRWVLRMGSPVWLKRKGASSQDNLATVGDCEHGALKEKELDKVDECKKAVQSHPPIPPASRTNVNPGNRRMAAPLIDGLDIKAAARVRVRACMCVNLRARACERASACVHAIFNVHGVNIAIFNVVSAGI